MALLCLAAVAGLGFQHSIGSHPWRSAGFHLLLLGGVAFLIRGFPFRRRAAWVVLGLSVAARLLMSPLAPSDDVNRYVWEGRVLNHGFDPYRLPPDAEALVSLRDDVWEGINHKSFSAIYPPGCLLVFRALAAVTTDPVGFKVALGAADVAAVALLLALLRTVDRRPAWALLYALNPVVLLSFAGEGHVDVLSIVFALAALLAFQQGRYAWMFVFVGLSMHVKYVSVLMTPFLFRRGVFRAAWILPATLGLPLLPFAPWEGLFHSLTAFSRDMHYNGSLHRVAGWLLGDYATASLVCAGLLIAWVAAVRLTTPRPIEGTALALSGLLLLSPNVHFWYLTWLIPLLCFYPYPPLLTLNATVVFSYATLGHQFRTNVWQEFPEMLWAEYLPVYAVLAAGVLRRRPAVSMRDAAPRPPVRTLSLVVPTLQDRDNLRGFLSRARDLDVTEMLVCDGGSTDGTPEAAAQAGAAVIRTSPGRGGQIAAGLAAATGEAVLIAHADTFIDPAVPARIREVLNRTGRLGGAVGCRFEHPQAFLRMISSLNGWRARAAGISFGDQGQFFRRDAVAAAGGFPEIPIMEDVEWSLRLRSIERPLFLGHGLVASARRWRRIGVLHNAALVVRLCLLYLGRRWRHGSGCPVDDLYARYYGQAPGPPPRVGEPIRPEGAACQTASRTGIHSGSARQCAGRNGGSPERRS